MVDLSIAMLVHQRVTLTKTKLEVNLPIVFTGVSPCMKTWHSNKFQDDHWVLTWHADFPGINAAKLPTLQAPTSYRKHPAISVMIYLLFKAWLATNIHHLWLIFSHEKAPLEKVSFNCHVRLLEAIVDVKKNDTTVPWCHDMSWCHSWWQFWVSPNVVNRKPHPKKKTKRIVWLHIFYHIKIPKNKSA